MKKSSSFLFCLFMAALLSAQGSAKKYVLIEHFTNSKCSICASKNPAFYNLIGQAQYADDVHHISVHPSFPYNTCVFYQANTTENSAWTALYPVQGTPTIAMNGSLQTPSSPMLTEAKLQTFLNQTSPLYLQVTESGPNNARMVNVKARALAEIPAGNYKIFVAIAEKTVNLQTPNGETVHHDVFRKMLTAVAGDAFAVPAVGATSEYNYQFSIPAAWNANEVYVLAFVKEVDTKAVLNSGTRFDPILSGTGEALPQVVRISPNPASDFAWVELADDAAQSLELFAANGQRVSVSFENQGSAVSIPTASLAPGIYFVKIVGKKGAYAGKFLKG
ncbi:MAG: Omp28-related outer membrane protein [Saprospiraceae bacterium]